MISSKCIEDELCLFGRERKKTACKKQKTISIRRKMSSKFKRIYKIIIRVKVSLTAFKIG
jgi:hypothetical protein